MHSCSCEVGAGVVQVIHPIIGVHYREPILDSFPSDGKYRLLRIVHGFRDLLGLIAAESCAGVEAVCVPGGKEEGHVQEPVRAQEGLRFREESDLATVCCQVGNDELRQFPDSFGGVVIGVPSRVGEELIYLFPCRRDHHIQAPLCCGSVVPVRPAARPGEQWSAGARRVFSACSCSASPVSTTDPVDPGEGEERRTAEHGSVTAGPMSHHPVRAAHGPPV